MASFYYYDHKFKFKFIYSHLFNYNTTTIRNKKEVKTELTIHRIKHNKGKECVAAKGAMQAFELATTT